MSIDQAINELNELHLMGLSIKAQADEFVKKSYMLREKLAGVSTSASPSQDVNAVVIDLVNRRNTKLFKTKQK